MGELVADEAEAEAREARKVEVGREELESLPSPSDRTIQAASRNEMTDEGLMNMATA